MHPGVGVCSIGYDELTAVLLLRDGASRESALLLQRGAVVGRFVYRVREEQSLAAVAAAVAKQKPASMSSGEQSDHQLSAGASRRTRH
jgi:hypothetical protein